MSLYDWLLFLHVTGAFFLIGGVVVAGILNLAAIGPKRRPSEIATLYRLIRFAVPLIGAGMLLTLAIGLWLVAESPWNYGYDDAWVIVALVRWAPPGWLDVGFIVTEPGAILVIVMLILAWLAARRPGFRGAVAVPWLASVYLLALGIAWFAMSAKPGS